MSASLERIDCQIELVAGARGGRRIVDRDQPVSPNEPAPTPATGRTPRVSRLMALAIEFDDLLRRGVAPNYATLAELAHVSRARITQVMNLLSLAPDIQEAILFLPSTRKGRDPIPLWRLAPIAQTPDWRRQRILWRALAPNA